MKHLKLTSFFILFLLPQLLHSQVNLFKPGYIISHNNDTVFGELRYTSGQRDNRVCVFKKADSQNEITYSPEEILGYRYNDGKFFVSKTMPVYKDTLTLFVEYLMKGRANLYYLEHKTIEHYYIEVAGQVTELTERDTVIAVNGPEYWAQREKYAGVRSNPYQATPRYYGKLRFILSDCPEILPRVESVQMEHKSLIKLGQDYHRLVCDDGECVVFERSVKPVKYKFGFVAGYSVSDMRLGNSHDKMVPGFFAGITSEAINVVSSKERISFRIDALLQYNKTLNFTRISDDREPVIFKYKGVNYYIVWEDDDVSTDTYVKQLDVDMNLLLLKVPVQVRYRFGSKSKWSNSASAGVLTSFTLSYNDEFFSTKMDEKYGQSYPGFMLGATAGLFSGYKTGESSEIYMGVSGEILTSLAEGYERSGASTINLQVGLRF